MESFPLEFRHTCDYSAVSRMEEISSYERQTRWEWKLPCRSRHHGTITQQIMLHASLFTLKHTEDHSMVFPQQWAVVDRPHLSPRILFCCWFWFWHATMIPSSLPNELPKGDMKLAGA